MSVYTTSLRFTGLSGIDTESMVTQLMKAQSVKLDRLKQENQITLWQQTAYRGVATAMQSFSNSFLSLASATSMRMTSTFKTNTTSIKLNGAESTAAKVTSSAGASAGSVKLNVLQLAQKETYASKGEVGGKITGGAALSTMDKLAEGDAFSVNFDGKTTTFRITRDDADALASAADYDAKLAEMLNKKFADAFGKEGGKSKVQAEVAGGKLALSTTTGHTAKITDVNRINTASGGTFDIADLFGPGEDTKDFSFRVFSSKPGEDPKDITIKLKKDATSADIAATMNKAISDSGVKGVSVAANADGSLKFSTNGTTDDDITIGGLLDFGMAATVTLSATKDTGAASNKLGITSGASTSPANTDTLESLFGAGTVGKSFSIGGTEITIKSGQTLGDLMKEISEKTNANLAFDSFSRTFSLEAKRSGQDYGFDITDTDNVLGGLFKIDTDTNGAGHVAAQDAQIRVNGGAVLNRDSNDIDVNGLKLTLNEVTGDGAGGALAINVAKDTSATLDTVKKFVEAYNTMLDAVNKELNTNRPKKSSYNYYMPLTDDQKGAMKEKEITDWENKAKEGLLYGDDILRSISSNMRDMLYRSVDLGGGKKLSLYEIGITTSDNYKDGGKLVIDEEKLKAALETRGEDVVTLFTKESSIAYKSGKYDGARLADEGLAERLNDLINNAIGSNGSITNKAGSGVPGSLTETSSTMYKLIKEQNQRISDMLSWLTQKETDYYSMFSKMEQAIMSANNQMAYLQSQLGIG